MSIPSHFDRIDQIIRATVSLEPGQAFSEQTELHTLGIDSLTTINLLVELSQQYEVDLEPFVEGLESLTTVGQLCALAERFAASRSEAAAPGFFKLFDEQALHYEYGLDGIRTFPWEGVNTPIGSGYCIVRPHSETLRHVNEPADEDELFIGIQGQAFVVLNGRDFPIKQGDQVFIPRGTSHSIRNDGDQAFHFFTVWWNQSGARAYLTAEDKPLMQAVS